MLSYKGASQGPQPRPVGWRDFQDIIVKWRQLSEPNDQVGSFLFLGYGSYLLLLTSPTYLCRYSEQVVWVDLLTEREFKQGFGSHTPIFSGQTQCVRYYMNFPRAFKLFKEIVAKVCEQLSAIVQVKTSLFLQRDAGRLIPHQ